MTITTKKTRDEQKHGYQEMKALVAQMTDALGQTVDAGIEETVVFLNLFGLSTSQSCEGHLEHGIAAPWVDIEETQIRREEREAMQRFALATQRKQHLGMVTEEVLRLLEEAHQAQLAVKKRHIALRQQLAGLLDAFYHQRIVPFDRRLIIQSRAHGKSRLESQGADMQDVRSPEERERQLSAYQQEMRAFTAFLKQQYMLLGDQD